METIVENIECTCGLAVLQITFGLTPGILSVEVICAYKKVLKVPQYMYLYLNIRLLKTISK